MRFTFDYACPGCGHEFAREWDYTRDPVQCPACKRWWNMDWDLDYDENHWGWLTDEFFPKEEVKSA